MRQETYANSQLIEIRRIERGPQGVRFILESPPGNITVDRPATPQETSSFLVEEQRQAHADSWAEMRQTIETLPPSFKAILRRLAQAIENRERPHGSN